MLYKYSFRLNSRTCIKKTTTVFIWHVLRLNKYHISDCKACTWYWIIFALCGTWHFKLSYVDVYSIFIFYLIFSIHAAVLMILLMLFGHPNVTAIQMSRSNLIISSFVFQSLASGFIVRSYFIVYWRDFFMAWKWPDYR